MIKINPDRMVERADGTEFVCKYVRYIPFILRGKTYTNVERPICMLDCYECGECKYAINITSNRIVERTGGTGIIQYSEYDNM